MAPVIAVVLESTVARVAYFARGQWRVAEHGWDPEVTERLVDLLRAEVPAPDAVVLAIGLGFLETSRPELPPLQLRDARRVLLRDTDRYFPLDEAPAVSAPGAGGIAFAMPAARLQRWHDAFAEWTAVRAVFAAPDCVAQALQMERQRAHTIGSGTLTYRVDAGDGEVGVGHFAARSAAWSVRENVRGTARGAVHGSAGNAASDTAHEVVSPDNGAYCVAEVRRIPAQLASADVQQLPSLDQLVVAGIAGEYAAAIGALDMQHAPVDAMLLDAITEARFRQTRTRRQWMSYAALAAVLLAFIFALDARREATLRITQQLVDSLSAVAQPGLLAQQRLRQFDGERTLLAAQASRRDDVLHVIAALSESLPRDAFVERLEWDGGQWRLDGSVNQASTVVPRLDSAPLFTDVHVLGASTRFRDGTRMRESFSVSFRTTGAPRGGR